MAVCGVSFSVKDALAGGGAILVALSFFIGGAVENTVAPLEKVEDVLVANAPAFNPCPPSWENTSTTGDEHTPVLSCQRDNGGVKWLAILNADGSLNYAFPLGTPNAVFIYDSAQVPGWPR